MKTEIILARVNEVLALNDDFVTARCKLESLSADLAEQVRTEYAASRGEANAAKTISALLKAVRKDCGKTALHYAWIDGKGRQCVCDGYRAFRLNEALPLEERPADAGDPINLDKVVPDIRKGYAAVALPSAKEVKAFIALERAAKGRKVSPVWDFGKDKPAVNAAYLVDLLNVLPDAMEIYYGGPFAPLYAKSERGDAVLLPVRSEAKNAEYAEYAEAQRARQQAAKDAADRAKFHADVLGDMLRAYGENVERNPEYALTPDDFANMVKYAQPAA
ncbi:MAG: hypothetical protein SOY94_13870 [Candidatus Limiplasma sp.]|nr:hypothetical protein [Candidatus Limiplasma sp.]